MKNQKKFKLEDLKVNSFLTQDDMNSLNGGAGKVTLDPMICDVDSLQCYSTGQIPCRTCPPMGTDVMGGCEG